MIVLGGAFLFFAVCFTIAVWRQQKDLEDLRLRSMHLRRYAEGLENRIIESNKATEERQKNLFQYKQDNLKTLVRHEAILKQYQEYNLEALKKQITSRTETVRLKRKYTKRHYRRVGRPRKVRK